METGIWMCFEWTTFRWRWISMQQFTSAIRFSYFGCLQWTTAKSCMKNDCQWWKYFRSETAAKCKRWKSDFALNENWSEKIISSMFLMAADGRRWIILFKFVTIKIGCSICENLQLRLTEAENCFCQMPLHIFPPVFCCTPVRCCGKLSIKTFLPTAR
jgi:hypothetical protein